MAMIDNVDVKKGNEPGICPVCKKGNLAYSYTEMECSDGFLSIPFTCDDCEAFGAEIYSVEYLRSEAEESE